MLGFDFNKAAEFCYCCGLELLQSGLNSFDCFCPECKEYIKAYAEQSGDLIPIERRPSTDDGEPFDTHSDQEIQLMEWARLIVKQNLTAMNLLKGEPVTLAQYMLALKSYERRKDDAFLEMCRFLP